MTLLMRNLKRGVTLTELLVVMVIIGLLSTIAVPVYINRAEQAKIAIAKTEARELAMAQETCALIHGYYVPLQLLDDNPAFRGVASQGDTIDLEPAGQIYLINPLVRPQDQIANQRTLADDNPRVRAMRENWQGPFLTFNRFFIGDGTLQPTDPNYINSTFVRLDFPLDPWGEPYRFYSPIGIIGTSARTPLGNFNPVTNVTVTFSDGRLTTQDDRNFDRYVIMSWGPDNLPQTDGSAQTSDDIAYFFGTAGVESTFGLYP